MNRTTDSIAATERRVRHFTIECEPQSVIEIVCCQPGNFDGCWMGYAIRFAGSWDGWVASPHDHQTMRKVIWNVTKEEAVNAVCDNWR